MRSARGRIAWLRRLGQEDDGSAVVEFVTVAFVILVPLVYLIVTFFLIQGAAFAAEGAAREAGRIVATSGDRPASRSAAQTAARLAFDDFGLSTLAPPTVRLHCEADPCTTPGARIHVTVSSRLPLPLISTGVAAAAGAVVPIEGRAVVVVDRFRQIP